MESVQQVSLPLVTAQPIPRTRGECLPGREARESGDQHCQHFGCRHNLLAELATMDPMPATRLAMRYLRGEVLDSCALDVADREASDRDVRHTLGLTVAELDRVTGQALGDARMCRSDFR